MKEADPVRRDGDDLILEIRLQPRASADAVVGFENGRLRIRVTAAPVEEAANRRMVAILAKEFGVARSRVRLLTGAHRRDKRVAIGSPRKYPRWLDIGKKDVT